MTIVGTDQYIAPEAYAPRWLTVTSFLDVRRASLPKPRTSSPWASPRPLAILAAPVPCEVHPAEPEVPLPASRGTERDPQAFRAVDTVSCCQDFKRERSEELQKRSTRHLLECT